MMKIISQFPGISGAELIDYVMSKNTSYIATLYHFLKKEDISSN